MQDYENRKLTPAELAGVIAAVLMFFGIGMIMGGTSAANDAVFYTGVGVFSVGSAIALYLLFKYKPKDDGDY
jgi:hypothetical protein